MKATILIGFLTICFTSLFAQSEVIYLKNPSFEDYPRAGRVPAGWIDCGFPKESPADTHPSGEFDVIKYPSHGNTYLGMVTRDNDTWERVGQKLDIPMIAGQCYIFKLSLCRSELYVSRSRMYNRSANYTQPIKLKVWGGTAFCDKRDMLGETETIEHSNWEDYIFTFYPNHNHDYLLLEAFYQEPVPYPYNGNLLIDNASPIIPIPNDSAIIWSMDKMESILLGTENLPVVINEEDIDPSAKNTATITAKRIGAPAELAPPTAIYYNSTLDDAEKELTLEEILAFVENNPFDKANIIIEEKTRKERKRQKELLIKKLTELDIREDNYRIRLYKN